MKITVIGDGGWGTAAALLLNSYGHSLTVWGSFPEYLAEIRASRGKVAEAMDAADLL